MSKMCVYSPYFDQETYVYFLYFDQNTHTHTQKAMRSFAKTNTSLYPKPLYTGKASPSHLMLRHHRAWLLNSPH